MLSTRAIEQYATWLDRHAEDGNWYAISQSGDRLLRDARPKTVEFCLGLAALDRATATMHELAGHKKSAAIKATSSERLIHEALRLAVAG